MGWWVSARAKDVERFYELLARLELRVGGMRNLANCHRNMGWPRRGVYFFFEEGEFRADSDAVLRVVRVGTHAVTAKSKSRLWNRLYEHKQDGGRSVFRDHINRALLNRAKRGRANPEHNHTRCISKYIGQMPFLWVQVDCENGHHMRTRTESNAIKLLSGWRNDRADAPSNEWLGGYSNKPEIEQSGLWNVQHVKGRYECSFLDELEICVENTEKLVEPAGDWDSAACVD